LQTTAEDSRESDCTQLKRLDSTTGCLKINYPVHK